MKYEELLRGVNAFASKGKNKNPTFPYSLYPEGVMDGTFYLDKVDQIRKAGRNVQQANQIIIDFLRRWNRRVQIGQKELRAAINTLFNNRMMLLNCSLQSSDDLWRLKSQITDIFSLFADAVKYTGASKALHLLNPNLFMMWDDKIRKGYGCSPIDEGYFNFLLRSQKEVVEIKESYIQIYQGDISRRIYQGRTRTILKLLDEYNYAKYTKRWI